MDDHRAARRSDGSPHGGIGGALNAADMDVTEFASYEDYLDTQVTPEDLYYLGDREMARRIIELGHKGKEILTRKEFERRKKRELEGPKKPKKKEERLCSFGKDVYDYPLLRFLKEKEKDARSGHSAIIIFIRDIDHRGHEVSGYIDYSFRLKTEDFEDYFTRKKKIMPKPSDLSYYNWRTRTLNYNNSPIFRVLADAEKGLLFKHLRDRKTIDVDPKARSSGNDNCIRRIIRTDEYLRCVVYEHFPRRKG